MRFERIIRTKVPSNITATHWPTFKRKLGMVVMCYIRTNTMTKKKRAVRALRHHWLLLRSRDWCYGRIEWRWGLGANGKDGEHSGGVVLNTRIASEQSREVRVDHICLGRCWLWVVGAFTHKKWCRVSLKHFATFLLRKGGKTGSRCPIIWSRKSSLTLTSVDMAVCHACLPAFNNVLR